MAALDSAERLASKEDALRAANMISFRGASLRSPMRSSFKGTRQFNRNPRVAIVSPAPQRVACVHLPSVDFFVATYRYDTGIHTVHTYRYAAGAGYHRKTRRKLE